MVIMGRVAAAQGIRGWVKIQPFTEYLDSLLDYPVWWIGKETGPWRRTEVLECEVHGKVLVAQLEDCADRNAAELLRGLLVAVPRSELPEQAEDEYYWSDLIGMRVVGFADAPLGTVDKLLETGANDVLCVRGDSGEILIPFVADVIRKVDVAQGVIEVNWSADYLK
jgi:16S rRNA processing protein RimM